VITGRVGDVWVKPDGEFIIVDYKATSKEEEVTLDANFGFSKPSINKIDGYFVYICTILHCVIQ